MDVLPIQSLTLVAPAAPAAERVGLATTRAIDFRPQDQSPDRNPDQHQQDATYTPSDNPQEQEMAGDFCPQNLAEEPPTEGSINLFA